MDTTAFVLAVIGVVISGALAAIKVWETFLSRSDFKVNFDWIDRPPPNEFELRFTIANVGHRPDGVREVSIATPAEVFQRDEIRDRLPVTLAPAEISAAFKVGLDYNRGDEPQAMIRDGTAELVLINSRGREHRFPIPPLEQAWSGRRSVRERTLHR